MRLPRLRTLPRAALISFVMVAGALGGLVEQREAGAASADLLILDSTLLSGTSSREIKAANNLGLTYDIVTATQWSAMTTSDFAAYKAIVLGDPDSFSTTSISAAEANTSVWGPAVTSNVVIIGTDVAGHSAAGTSALIEKGIKFAASEPSKTGAYITLSEYYDGASPSTPVPVLNAFGVGSFTATGTSCADDAHIVATHSVLAGLTDALLSNWGCSVHNGFDLWPITFEVLAIDLNSSASYTATDGTVGTPYILARGENLTVISDITLSPDNVTSTIGSTHTLTATVAEDSAPVVGATVSFKVIAGPHTGITGTGVTSSSGQATFSYTGTSTGEDTIEAKFVDSTSATQRSNKVTIKWSFGFPATSNISASPTAILADGISSSTITVQAKDNVGNNATVGGATVTLATTLGSISSVTDNGNGTYTATVTSSTTAATATVSGTLDGLTISDTAFVRFFLASAATSAHGINFFSAGHTGTIQNLTITVTVAGTLSPAVGIRTAGSPTISSNVISSTGDVAAGILSESGSPTISANIAVTGASTGTLPFDPYDPYDPYDPTDPYLTDAIGDQAISGSAAAIVLHSGSATIDGNAIKDSVAGVGIFSLATATINNNSFTANDVAVFVDCGASTPTISANLFTAGDALDIGIRWPGSSAGSSNVFSGYASDRAEIVDRCLLPT